MKTMSSPAVETVRTIPLIIEQRKYDKNDPTEDGGFSFDRDSDKEDRGQAFRSQLDDLAKRHPEFAEHLNFGGTFPLRSNLRDRLRRENEPTSGASSQQHDPFEEYRRFTDRPFGSRFQRFPFGRSFDEPDFGTRHQEPQTAAQPEQQHKVNVEKQQQQQQEQPKQAEETKVPTQNLAQSNTVDLGQKQTPVEDVRNQRSMSAPPDNRNTQQRFVSSCTIPINRESAGGGENMGAKPSHTPKPEPAQHQSRSNERVIPIHVEGRDEPVIPKNVHQTFTQQPPQPEKVFGHKPSHFTQFLNRENSVPQQQEFFKQQQPQAQKQPPKPQQKEVPVQQPPPCAPSPPPQQQQQLPPSQIDKIQAIQKDVLELMNQVETFAGKYRDKQYLYLDEMLTRNLIKLDNIDTEGKDNIRQARREAIKCIEKCISILEAKAQANDARNSQTPIPLENKMETEPTTEVKTEGTPQPMETEPIITLEVSGVSRSGTQSDVPTEDKPQEAEPVKEETKVEMEVEQTPVVPEAPKSEEKVEGAPETSQEKKESAQENAESKQQESSEKKDDKPKEKKKGKKKDKKAE